MATRRSHLRALMPYLIGEEARENGEWDMFCPLHEDTKRSASLNTHSSEWFCQAGCGGGSVVELIAQQSDWVPPPSDRVMSRAKRYASQRGQTEELPSEAEVQGYASALQSNSDRMDWLLDYRLLTTDTITKYELGWDQDQSVYTIPIRDKDGSLVNLRKYDPNPRDARRKIWGITGHNEVRLWPLDQLEADEIFIVEGEWDTLLLISHGIPTVTRTGSAVVWNRSWGVHFKNKIVHSCHDCDKDGQRGAVKVVRSVGKFARHADNVVLPFEIEPKHGKDVTDFFREFTLADFERLYKAPPTVQHVNGNGYHPELINLPELFSARHTTRPVNIQLMVTGHLDTMYMTPKRAVLRCDQSAGKKCSYCPIFQSADGVGNVEFKRDDPRLLGFTDVSEQVAEFKLMEAFGVPGGKCPVADITVTEYHPVDSLLGKAPMDLALGDATNSQVRIYSSANEARPNETSMFTGSVVPHPKDSSMVFYAWKSEPQAASIDNFEVTPEVYETLSTFCPDPGQRPLERMMEISTELAQTVTGIYGRLEMHMLMDMVWHSVLSWPFEKGIVPRGWLDALVIGDTQQGKSETAKRLAQHYGAGEIINCEAASLPGLTIGLQTIGSKWHYTYGGLVTNSGRLVVLEEASGLTQEQISQLSDIRSSGVARIQKIKRVEAMAKTRLLWLANPRKRKMADFMYGVQAIKPLIGSDEDVARFDIAMSVASGEVAARDMNMGGHEMVPHYSSEACSTLVRWVWSRKPEQVEWLPGAEAEVKRQALRLAGDYTDTPPLVQAANVRFKLARIAVAIAARTFSADNSGDRLLVGSAHVKDAVKFIDHIYGMRGFGYQDLSLAARRARDTARDNFDDTKVYLAQPDMAGLHEFLMMQPRFRRQDLEEVLNVDRQVANQVVNRLLGAKMVQKEGANVVVGETLHRVLRELARGRR